MCVRDGNGACVAPLASLAKSGQIFEYVVVPTLPGKAAVNRIAIRELMVTSSGNKGVWIAFPGPLRAVIIGGEKIGVEIRQRIEAILNLPGNED